MAQTVAYIHLNIMVYIADIHVHCKKTGDQWLIDLNLSVFHNHAITFYFYFFSFEHFVSLLGYSLWRVSIGAYIEDKVFKGIYIIGIISSSGSKW